LVDVAAVNSVRERLPDDDSVERLAYAFGLLSDPGRVRLLIALREAGDMCVCDLAAVIEMGESATSHALRLLRAAGVVKARRSGRHVNYSLTDAHVTTLLDVVLEHYGHERNT
jgi:DNA-binding transcriptional ArsR family regulator